MTPSDLLTPLESIHGEPPREIAVFVRRLCIYAPRSVGAWALMCGTSRRTMLRRLRGAGLPHPRAFLNLRRLMVAHEALRRGLHCEDAAYMGAYADAATLSHACKHHVGLRPGKLRRVRSEDLVRRWYERKAPVSA